MPDVRDLCGWAGPEIAKEAFDLFGDEFNEFRVFGDAGPKPARVMLFDYTRKLLGGKDVENIPQEVGDCCSWGGRNAVAYVQALPILNGAALKWTDVFPPYLYGTSRVQIGGGRISGDGSTGAWTAAAALKFGAIDMRGNGVPPYSGSVARQWGKGNGPPATFLTEGGKHLAKSVAKVKNVDEAVEAVKNGYPVTLASNQGFTMTAQSSDYHEASGRWLHQVCLIGVDTGEDGGLPCGAIVNSWGPSVHGTVVDAAGTWPPGMIRARLEVIDGMIKQDDSFAWSAFDGFPAQRLTLEDFYLW